MKIGILGGSFDPAHKGHLAISKEAKRRFKLEKIIWAVTKKNPLKAESKTPISKKIKDCKKIIGLNSFIKVKFYEKNQILSIIFRFYRDYFAFLAGTSPEFARIIIFFNEISLLLRHSKIHSWKDL